MVLENGMGYEKSVVVVNAQCLISASCMNLRSKTWERLSGSKPTFPTMDPSSRVAGCSMKGIDGDTFIETAERDTLGALHTAFPLRLAEKPVTAGATKANIIVDREVVQYKNLVGGG